ncbi:MAG: glycosyl transferase [Planctomycetota bacterium]|nr:MAG: glycosyl transferase [Planctomycetota bacterium]
MDEIYNPQRIKQADLIVGIPSYNEARTIGFVTKQVARGLKEYFPHQKSVIVNVDNNSPDGTREAFLFSKPEVPLIYISTPKGIKGKGYNFRNLFSLFQELKAKIGIVIDADLRSIEPVWIKDLAEPILSGYEFAAPFYARAKDDATITNQIAYPLVYGLLGMNLRQPIGGEFSFSKKLVDTWISHQWSEYVNQFGIDIFMTATAIFSGAKVCQVNLVRKIHKSSTPNLGPMFVHVVGAFFEIIKSNLDKVKEVTQIKEVPILGSKNIPEVKNTIPDWSNFERSFKEEFELREDRIEECVSEEIQSKIEEIKQDKIVNIDVDMWMKIVYDFLYSFQKEEDSNSIKALRCLYFGRVASFFREIAPLSPAQSEEKVVEQARYFFKNRDYFLSKYLQ